MGIVLRIKGGGIKVAMNVQFFILFPGCLQNTCFRVGQDGHAPTSYVICICRGTYEMACEWRPVRGHCAHTHTVESINRHVTNVAQRCLQTETFRPCRILNTGSNIKIYISVKPPLSVCR